MRQLALLPVCTWVLAACCASGVFADDMDIARQLSNRLRVAKAEGNLRGFRINVKVEDSVVWLSGNVPNSSQQDLALQHAQEIPGVRLVVNDITVGDAVGDGTIGDTTIGDTASFDAELAELNEEPVPPVVSASQIDQALITEPKLNANSLPSNRLVSRVSASGGAPDSANSGTQHLVTGVGTQQVAELRQAVPMELAVPANQGVSATPYVLMPNYGYVGVVPAGMAGLPAQAVPSMVHVVPAVAPSPSQNGSAGRPVPIAAARPARLVNYHCDSGGCYGEGAPVGTPMSECAGGFCTGAPQYMGGFDGGMPQSAPGSNFGGGYGAAFGGAQYENPQMPPYAWPSYASHPNYAAVTYPRQYSPMAWPYIGPFYPYPQVPLGWRKVCLEWDDGWWMLDFKSKSK